MAQKQPTQAALKNVLETAVELLQDADDAGCDGMVTLNNSVYMRLRAAVKEATGVAHGIAVSNESELDDEEDEEEEEDDEDQPEEDDR
jgi:hypothetical protein